MTEKPRRIRFSKSELERIDRLTSEGSSDSVPAAVTRKRSFLSRFYQSFLSVCIVLILLGGTGFIFLRGGINSDLLRVEAQKSLNEVLGKDATATIGNAALSLNADSLIAVEAQDVSISDPPRGLEIQNIRFVRLGLSPLQLLKGKLRIAELEISGADFELPERQGAGFWKTLPYDNNGLIDFDALSGEIFAAMERNLELLRNQNTKTLGLTDTTIRFKVGDTLQSIYIDNLRLVDAAGKISLNGEVLWDGETVELAGTITNSENNRQKLDDFKLQITGIPVNIDPPEQVTSVIDGNHINPAHFEFIGAADLLLKGNASSSGEAERLSAVLDINNIDMQLGRVDGVRGNLKLHLEHVVGSGKLEIRPSHVQLDGMNANFNGAFGPDPENEGKGENSAYRFEIVTSSASSLPVESTDPQLAFAVHIAGQFLPEKQRLLFSGLDVKTATGELYGQGSMGFGQGSPEMIFLLRIPHMPVADAKHLWPIDVADGAREWVMKNLFGGTLKDSRIDISLAGGRFNGPGRPPPLTESEIKADFNISDTRFDVIGELPPVRDVVGNVKVRGAHTTIKLDKGVAYTADNRHAQVSDGTLIIPWGPQRPVMAELDLLVSGEAAAITEIAGKKPIDILKNIPFTPQDMSGEVDARMKVSFAITKGAPPDTLKWNADIGFKELSISKAIGGVMVTDASGTIEADRSAAIITADAMLAGIPAKISMTEPIDRSGPAKKQEKITLVIDDKARNKLFPSMADLFSGPMTVELGMLEGKNRSVQADLSKTRVDLPWIGWQKGAGIPARVNFTLVEKDGQSNFDIRNLVLTGETFGAKGSLSIANGSLQSADLSDVKLNRSDRLSLKAAKNSAGYRITVNGKAFDARALIKKITKLDQQNSNGTSTDKTRLVLSAELDEVSGFHGETLKNVALSFERAGDKVSGMSVNATTTSGQGFTATNNDQGNARSISLQSDDAGAILRFFDYYDKMQGGKISLGLAGQGNSPLSGKLDARNFAIINEPRLATIVASPPDPGGRSLNQAVKRNIDVSRVNFERGFSFIEMGKGYLKLSKGVVRGPTVGATFQGVLYDPKGNMEITGTFMPAYGVNRIFGEVPILGALLGNGRDRGLLGITFKLTGSAKQPHVIVNPISIIAPGIFRSIFEF